MDGKTTIANAIEELLSIRKECLIIGKCIEEVRLKIDRVEELLRNCS